jgi:hypothetical protein
MRSKNRGFKAGHPAHHVDWAVDYDYVDKLSPEELKWLETFTREHYFSWSKLELQTREQVRDRRRAYKAGQRDLMSRGATLGKAVPRLPRRPADHSTEDQAIELLEARRGRERVDSVEGPSPEETVELN